MDATELTQDITSDLQNDAKCHTAITRVVILLRQSDMCGTPNAASNISFKE